MRSFAHYCLSLTVFVSLVSCSNQAVTGSIYTVSSDYVIVSGGVEKKPSSYCGIQYSQDPRFDSFNERRAWELGEDLSFRMNLNDLEPNAVYYYRAFVRQAFKYYYGETRSFRTEDFCFSATAVDLGLPSGTLWSSSNLGAKLPEELGVSLCWGETEVEYNRERAKAWSDYKWGTEDHESLIKYCTKTENGYNGFVDNKTSLEFDDDGARVHLGYPWRTPTDLEWTELQKEYLCEWSFETVNGIGGYRVTSKTNGNSIFLPFGNGYYMSSTLDVDFPVLAFCFDFSDEKEDMTNIRSLKYHIRPVMQSYGDN